MPLPAPSTSADSRTGIAVAEVRLVKHEYESFEVSRLVVAGVVLTPYRMQRAADLHELAARINQGLEEQPCQRKSKH